MKRSVHTKLVRERSQHRDPNSQKERETTQTSANWGMERMRYVHKMEYYAGMKRNEGLTHAVLWRDLENAMPVTGHHTPCDFI